MTSWHGSRPPEENHIVVAAYRERDEARAEVQRLHAAWEKDNLCGICPYRQAVQAENERLREALEFCRDTSDDEGRARVANEALGSK